MHEKRAKEKEKSLLEQEKQLYHARIRSQIRAKLAGKSDPFPETGTKNGHGPMSPNDHIKALADRFMKAGAEDLWNERDGPIKSRPSTPQSKVRTKSIPGSPIDLRKMITKRRNLAGNGENVNLSNLNGNYVRARNYSVQSGESGRKSENFSTRDDSGFESKGDSLNSFVGSSVKIRVNSKFGRNVNGVSVNEKFSVKKKKKKWRNDSSSSEDYSEFDSEDDSGMASGWNVRKMGSSASLGKYDMKIKRRIPLNSIKEVSDFSQQVELLRHEISKKNLADEEKGEEESILSQKR